jgi:hypothetical protein
MKKNALCGAGIGFLADFALLHYGCEPRGQGLQYFVANAILALFVALVGWAIGDREQRESLHQARRLLGVVDPAIDVDDAFLLQPFGIVDQRLEAREIERLRLQADGSDTARQFLQRVHEISQPGPGIVPDVDLHLHIETI